MHITPSSSAIVAVENVMRRNKTIMAMWCVSRLTEEEGRNSSGSISCTNGQFVRSLHLAWYFGFRFVCCSLLFDLAI